MSKNAPSEALQATIDSLTAVIMRHGPGENTRTFICMATHLGGGTWATMRDGVFGGRVYDQFTGDHQAIDLWVHPVTGGEFPARWGHLSIMRPVALIHAPGSGASLPDYATAAEMSYPDHRLVWRNSFGGAKHFSDLEFDPTTKMVAVECRIYHRPLNLRWSPHRDDITPAVCAGMDYPGNKDAGGPVVDEQGRLAGMLLGPGAGSGEEHKGWYIPVDYILPSLAMALESAPRSRERFGSAIHYVEHPSHEVEFD